MDIIIDHGEKIYIAKPGEIDEVIKNILAREKKKVPDWEEFVHNFGEVCKKYTNAGLNFGYSFVNGDEEKGSALPIAMYKKELGYQRVQFENSKCLNCQSAWRIGNPSYLGIYPGYKFYMSELEYPLLDCPKCGGKLSRNAIWIGEELDPKTFMPK